MKNAIHSKLAQLLLIGTASVLTLPATADSYDSTPRYGNPAEERRIPAAGALEMPDSSQSEADRTMQSAPPAAGDQGPLRSDMDDDQWLARPDMTMRDRQTDREGKKDDYQRLPMWQSNTP